MTLNRVVEKEKARFARRIGERAAVDLINAGYSVTIRRTKAGSIFLAAVYKRRVVKNAVNLRKRIYRRRCY